MEGPVEGYPELTFEPDEYINPRPGRELVFTTTSLPLPVAKRRRVAFDIIRHSGATATPSSVARVLSSSMPYTFRRGLRRHPGFFRSWRGRYVRRTPLNRRLDWGMRARRRLAGRGGYAGPGYASTRPVLPAARFTPFYGPRIPIRPERHQVHVDAASNQLIDDLGGVAHLNVIPRGDSIEQRQGSRVRMLQVMLDMKLFASVKQASINTGGTRNDIDLFLVYDKRPTGTLPSFATVFDHVGIHAQQNLSSRDRFLVLQRWSRGVGASPAPNTAAVYPDYGGPGIRRPIQVVIPLNLEASWITTNTDGSLGGMTFGALYLYWISDWPNADTANSPTIYYDSRVQFVDA